MMEISNTQLEQIVYTAQKIRALRLRAAARRRLLAKKLVFLTINGYCADHSNYLMKTSTELFSEAQTLMAQANEILRHEKSAVIAELKMKIAQYQITSKDLGFGSAPQNRQPAREANVFVGPAGQTWSGRGRRPQWLKDAIANGATPEQFKVS